MGMLDGLLGQIGGADQLAQLASKVGLSEDQVKMGMSALGKAHPEPGDTVQSAAASTGLPTDKLQGLLGAIGGESTLNKYASFLDKDGDGSVMDDVMDMAKGLFDGKK
jgi:hypothetical protein